MKLYSGSTPSQVAQDLSPLVDFQADGLPLPELEKLLTTNLLPHLMRYDQPGFQSMFNAFPPDEAKLGAEIALAYNQGVTNWQVSPGGAVLEEMCCQALCRLFGLAQTAEATFMLSGTYANQQALYLALHRHAQRQGFNLAQKGLPGFTDPSKLAVLISQDAHFSLKQAVRMLGLGEDSLVLLPLDERRRVDVKAMREVVAGLHGRRQIICLVATAGTTSTGAVDPIEPMADLSADIGAWLHIDGAYGYAYKLVPEWAYLFAGDNRADSITWDPHKQLGAPIPNSLLFLQNGREFGRMTLHSGYFNRAADVEPNPGLKSPPSTRPLAALPLVTLLRGKGLAQLITDLRTPLIAIRQLASYLQTQPDIELCHQPDTGILCFRFRPPGVSDEALDSLQRNLYERLMATGERTISTTTWNRRTVLRLVTVSPHTTLADLQATIHHLFELA
jgi:L-2,4-diaminobutyrate decarboxylase